jgi:hypothetical protein
LSIVQKSPMLSAQSSTPISAALDASSVALPARAMSGDEADRRRWTPPLLRGGSAGLAEEEEEHEASAALPARTVTCGARSMVCWKEKENAGTSMERFFFEQRNSSLGCRGEIVRAQA